MQEAESSRQLGIRLQIYFLCALMCLLWLKEERLSDFSSVRGRQKREAKERGNEAFGKGNMPGA